VLRGFNLRWMRGRWRWLGCCSRLGAQPLRRCSARCQSDRFGPSRCTRSCEWPGAEVSGCSCVVVAPSSSVVIPKFRSACAPVRIVQRSANVPPTCSAAGLSPLIVMIGEPPDKMAEQSGSHVIVRRGSIANERRPLACRSGARDACEQAAGAMRARTLTVRGPIQRR
jgi:hypothetical protein